MVVALWLGITLGILRNPDPQSTLATRPFHLGFTPFPYDISLEAVDWTYQTLAKDSDMTVHSIDDGVPWNEALLDAPFPKKVTDDWKMRAERTPKNHVVYVQVNPLDLYKKGIATDLSAIPNGEWNQKRLDDPKVEKAFLNYCRRAITSFHPSYFGLAIESNLLLTNSPNSWPAYINLHQYIYRELKNRYPSLPVFSTFVAPALLQGYAPEHDVPKQRKGLHQLLPYCDAYAISLYPYMSVYTAEQVPAGMFDELFGLSEGKPIVISETGYPAAEFSINNGAIPFHGTPAKQASFIGRLLAEAQRRKIMFINNFVLRDYEALWIKVGRTDIAAVWKNDGLYDANGLPRPALGLWKWALARPYRP